MRYIRNFTVIFSLLFISAVFSQPIIDKSNMDLGVKPGDDFFNYANGSWVKNTPIPPDMVRYGAFDKLREDNNTQLRSIVESCAADKNLKAGSNEQKIGDFFASGMDEEKINSLGFKPVQKTFEDIEKINSKSDAVKFISELHSKGVYPLFYFGSSQDEKNSMMNIAFVRQAGMTLGNKDYYVKDDERMKSIRAEYVIYMTKMFKLIGNSDEESKIKAEKILAFETKLAVSAFSNIELRDPEGNYNKMSLNDLSGISPDFDWKLYFKSIGIENPGDINVGQKRYFIDLSNTFKDASLEDLKIYLQWRVLNGAASFLSSDFVNTNFDFFGKFLSGAQEMRPRWKRVLDVVNGSMGEALGEIYVKKYFPPEAKQRITDLVSNLKSALTDRINNLSWMQAATKKQALDKLNMIVVKVGYPDKWEDYTKLNISRDSYWDNLVNVRVNRFKKELEEIGKPVDKSKWGMSPQTVNAYYSPNQNEICFPAGILQPPFFFANGDDAVNYGGIGAVIGHEITHGFDDQGRKYDKEGNLNDWWTSEDGKNFETKAQVLVDQYDNFIVIDTFHVDGKFTLGENIADLGGITIALEGLKKAWTKKAPEKEIEGFTPIQRFFLSYAQIWRGNIRDKELLRRLKEDEHSPSVARVNGIVYNVPEFYDAFNIGAGDKRYKDVNSRAIIW